MEAFHWKAVASYHPLYSDSNSHSHSTGTDSTPSADASYPEFADIFIIFWIGSIVVTVNSKLLGGHISFFQCVCVLGYCVLPLAIALIVCRIILFAISVDNWKVGRGSGGFCAVGSPSLVRSGL